LAGDFVSKNLDKLAGFISGTPIRSVGFVDAIARSEHSPAPGVRMEQVDQLLFGNKLIESLADTTVSNLFDKPGRRSLTSRELRHR
jgi:hypothetical protein